MLEYSQLSDSRNCLGAATISKRTHQDVFGIEIVEGIDLMDNLRQNKRY